jgi:hypothetical protein
LVDELRRPRGGQRDMQVRIVGVLLDLFLDALDDVES